jgi:hypothetical protein
MARARCRLLLVLACAIALEGCGGHNRQSSLAPKSGPAHDISTLWWGMLAAATIVFAGAVFFLVLSWIRRRREGLPLLGVNEQATNGLVVLFGIVIPICVGLKAARRWRPSVGRPSVTRPLVLSP